MQSLYNELVEYSKKGIYPMHMPGHKRNDNMLKMVNPYSIDITEIDGFDNMHEADGILKDITNRCKKLYNSGETLLCVSGSSIGLLSAIAACTKTNDKIVVARNSHKAIYNAIYLNGLRPIYIYPNSTEYGFSSGIDLADIRKTVDDNWDEKDKIKAVVITSPTYEGIVSDIAAISNYLHHKGIILIVDSAHGAHLGFCDELADNAINQGADIVIHSIHKTLPAFTQTALVHVSKNNKHMYDKVKKYMSIYQSSSPSYVLMAGIDRCIELIENDKEKLFKDYIDNLCWFYSKVSSLKYIKVICKEDLQVFDFDYGKIIITCASNIELVNDKYASFGEYIYRILYDKYKIQLEMKSVNYALAMTSICDTREGIQRLAEALCDIDKHIFNDFKVIDNKKELNYQHNILEIYCTVTESDKYLKKEIDFNECVNQVSANYVYLFPPGIPLVVPGEIISEDIYINILNYLKCGFEVHGITKNKKISVLEIA